MPNIEIRNLPVNPNPLALSDILPVDPSATTTTVSNTVHDIVCAGPGNTASGLNSRTEGALNTASGAQSHAEGNNTIASANNAHSEGTGTLASGNAAHAEGNGTQATANEAHAEGINTIANQGAAHAEGDGTTASGTDGSHAEGQGTTASGQASHAEGQFSIASAAGAHCEGGNGTATGIGSHAEGGSCASTGNYSHAEGLQTTAGAVGSHAEGFNSVTLSTAVQSHAEGNNSTCIGPSSHAGGVAGIGANYNEWQRGIRDPSLTGTYTAYGIIGYGGATTNATPTEIFLDDNAATQRFVLYVPSTAAIYNVRVYVTAFGSAGVATFSGTGAITSVSGTVSLLATITMTQTGSSGTFGATSVTATADNVNKSLKITVAGIAATNIKWVCRVDYDYIGL